MGFLAAAAPYIIQGGAALGGALLGRHAQSSAMKRSPEEMAALSGAQGSANALSTQGTNLINQGSPMLGQAGNYWSTLLKGNRAQMSEATAAPRAAITDIYRGAGRNLERSGIRGAQRDLATAELGRDQAGKIAGLTTGVQPAAAEALAGVGSDLTRTGAGMAQGAGSIWANLLGQGQHNREYGRQEGEKFGTSMGGLLFDILNGSLGKFGNKSTAGASSAGTSMIGGF